MRRRRGGAGLGRPVCDVRCPGESEHAPPPCNHVRRLAQCLVPATLPPSSRSACGSGLTCSAARAGCPWCGLWAPGCGGLAAAPRGTELTRMPLLSVGCASAAMGARRAAGRGRSAETCASKLHCRSEVSDGSVTPSGASRTCLRESRGRRQRHCAAALPAGHELANGTLAPNAVSPRPGRGAARQRAPRGAAPPPCRCIIGRSRGAWGAWWHCGSGAGWAFAAVLPSSRWPVPGDALACPLEEAGAQRGPPGGLRAKRLNCHAAAAGQARPRGPAACVLAQASSGGIARSPSPATAPRDPAATLRAQPPRRDHQPRWPLLPPLLRPTRSFGSGLTASSMPKCFLPTSRP